MIRLVSLQRCKFFNRIFHSLDDEMIDLSILAASQAVLDYLGATFGTDLGLLDFDGNAEVDSDGNPLEVDEVEQVATAILAGKMHDGSLTASDLEYGRLPKEVTSLLYIRRKQMGFA
jgi:hypothetical protein